MFLLRLFEIDPLHSMTCMLWLHILLLVFCIAVEEPLHSLAVDLDQWKDRKMAQQDIDLMKSVRHFGPKLTLFRIIKTNSKSWQIYPNPKWIFFSNSFLLKIKIYFSFFCELRKLYSSKVILWNEEEGIICLNDEVERCPKDSIIKYFQLSYRFTRKRPSISKFIFWIILIQHQFFCM